MQGLACSSMACVTSTCYNAAHLGNFRVLASLEQLVLRFLGKEVSGQAHRDVPLEELPATKGSSSHPEGRRQRLETSQENFREYKPAADARAKSLCDTVHEVSGVQKN